MLTAYSKKAMAEQINPQPALTPDLELGGRVAMETVLLQFKHHGSMPTLEEVRRLFHLEADEIDTQFGVIATDPTEGIYTVLVNAKASQRVQAVLDTRPPHPGEGIFSNPRIEPFGQPEK